MPAKKSGQPKLETCSRYPAASGLIDDARLRGTDVMLAAAARSEGDTTAMTYELRVGTSICESALRTRSSKMTQGKLGISGMISRSALAGRCVNTMVLISPNLLAMRTAIRYENALRTPLQKKIVAASPIDS